MAEQTREINKDIADRGKAVVEGAREKVVDLLGSARGGTGKPRSPIASKQGPRPYGTGPPLHPDHTDAPSKRAGRSPTAWTARPCGFVRTT